MSISAFRFGDWLVDPATNSIHDGAEQRQMEPRAMDVLVTLTAHAGAVVTTEQLLTACWGSNIGGDNPVHKTIAQLRKVLGDSSSAPRYIETIRKRGYRTVADLQRSNDAPEASWLNETPFRGLAAFEERHSAVFFGRADASNAVLRAIDAQMHAGRAMVLVLGPSGSGKTSLIRAGVLAGLIDGTAPINLRIGNNLYVDCADLAETDLYGALGSVLLDAEGADGAPLFEHDSAASLGARLVADVDAVIARLLEVAQASGTRTALFIDRFEALLRDADIGERERAGFVDMLDRLAASGAVLVLLACRNDFYPHLASIGALMALKANGGHVDVAAPSGAEIAQMVRQPARAAGLRFGTRAIDGAALDDELCAAARDRPDALPLLQYCLEELYRQRTDDNTLSFAVYQQLGGIDGAIGARAEQVLTGLGAGQIAALPHVLSLLVQVAEDELAVTARPAPWSALASAPAEDLVKALVDARLVTSSLHAGTAVFGLAHEALLRRWPRVVAWVDSHRQSLQVRTRIAASAARWDKHGRSRDLLLPRGLQANQAKLLRQDSALGLEPLTGAYIDASLRRVRRGETVRVVIFSVMSALALLALALSVFARSAQREAEQHRNEAEGLMSFMLGDFVERLRPLGRLDLLDSVSNRALVYLADGRHEASGAALAQRAKALQVLSEVKMARGDAAGAESALLLGRDILQRQLAASPHDAALLKSAGANAFWLGQLHFDRSDWTVALRYFTQYRQFADRQAAAAPDDMDGVIEQSYAHSSVGSAALGDGQTALAVEEFARSVALKTTLLAQAPNNDKLAADLANSLSWQASAQAKLGKLDAARELYQREVGIMRKLHEASPANAGWTQRYGFALSHQGEMNEALGLRMLARDDYAHAATLLRTIVNRDASNVDLLTRLQTIEVMRFGVSDDSGATSAGWTDLQEQLDKSAEREPAKPKLARLAAAARVRQAEMKVRSGQFASATQILAPGLHTLEALNAKMPADQAIAKAYAEALLIKAELISDVNAGRELCRKARDVLEPANPRAGDYTVLVPWVQASICAGYGAQISTQLKQLESMKYQEPHFVTYLANHPHIKGTP
ncbi:winged helix-turn-helix domain-containing protein [Massilia sp. DWR3-1-1]|uniref:nSTAND1 domain-containing NTPase n=1 Tax=Massilia sp. DWR3-1-1 TaxID=2804559 RepID=UPI003CF92FE8